MKTENLPTRFISDVDHVAEETGSFRKGLYQAAIRFQTRSHKLFQVRIFSARIIKIG